MATDLARFAASLRANPSNRSFLDHVSFPMYTVPAEFLLQMKHLKTHGEMLQVGALVEFSTDLGRAMFVSHEWLSNRHPDPNAEQLQILQQALRNIASGSSNICVPVATEIMFGRLQLPRADSVGVDLYIWYDYFCCPQHSSNAASLHRQAAIDSIPTYVSQCYFFVILCPALKHVDQSRTLSQSSWALRGWCRCERVARELAAREDGYIIVIESAVHQTLVWLGNRMLEAPGEGDFTVKQDKVRVGRMMVRMIWDKLLYYLERGDLHNYRFLSNSQRARFFRGLDVVPIESFIPPSGVQADAFREPDKFLLEWFLHQNGFRGVSERDEKGWSPLCFAALNGDPLTIKSLLRYRADPNDMTAKARIKAGGVPVSGSWGLVPAGEDLGQASGLSHIRNSCLGRAALWPSRPFFVTTRPWRFCCLQELLQMHLTKTLAILCTLPLGGIDFPDAQHYHTSAEHDFSSCGGLNQRSAA